MTMILEVIHADGSRTRHQLDSAPLTIGRGLTNDVIVDDPYADVMHARLSLDGEQVLIEDLGSVNGIIARDERLSGAAVARAGDVLRIGRTSIRLRDPHEVLPPALLDVPNGRAPVPRRRIVELATTTAGGLLLVCVTLAVLGLNTWLGSSARSSAGDTVGEVLGYAILITIWAGMWSIASRIILHQFRFFGHLAVISALVLVALGWSVTQSWLSFFFPDAGLTRVLAFLFGLALVSALVIGHLGLASTMPRRRRWRAGAMVAGSLLAITALVSFTKDDSFSDVPKFAAVVKPAAPALIPTKSIDQFESMTQQLEEQVDQLAKK